MRYRLLLAVWSRGAICPVPHERDGTVQGTCGKDEIHAHKRAGIWYHIRRQFKNRCILCIGWHCWNLRNFIVCAKRGIECTRMGACLSRGSHRAFSGPQQDTGKECALFLFPCSERGHWKTEWNELIEQRERRAPAGRDALPHARTETDVYRVVVAYPYPQS